MTTAPPVTPCPTDPGTACPCTCYGCRPLDGGPRRHCNPPQTPAAARVTLIELGRRDGTATIVFLRPDGRVSSYSGTPDADRIVGRTLHFECDICGVPFREHPTDAPCCHERERWRYPAAELRNPPKEATVTTGRPLTAEDILRYSLTALAVVGLAGLSASLGGAYGAWAAFALLLGVGLGLGVPLWRRANDAAANARTLAKAEETREPYRGVPERPAPAPEPGEGASWALPTHGPDD